MQIFFPGGEIPVVPVIAVFWLVIGILYLLFKKEHLKLKYRYLAKKTTLDPIDYRTEITRSRQVIKRLKITMNLLTFTLLQFIAGEIFIKVFT